jgi:hypothetical protein
MSVELIRENIWKSFVGLSTDTKPVTNVPSGSEFFEEDTYLTYLYTPDKEWVLRELTGNQIIDRASLALGEIPGWNIFDKFGEAFGISTSDYVDVWDYEDAPVYTYTTVAQKYYISSTSPLDTVEISVGGLDESLLDKEVFITLQGQTKIEIGPGLWWRVHRAFNNNSADLVGNVYIYEDDTVTNGEPDTPSKVRATIQTGNNPQLVNNQTLMIPYTIPANKIGYLSSLAFTITSKAAGNIIIRTYVRQFGKVFRLGPVLSLRGTGSSVFSYSLDPFIIIPPGADFRVMVSADAPNMSIGVRWDMYQRTIG